MILNFNMSGCFSDKDITQSVISVVVFDFEGHPLSLIRWNSTDTYYESVTPE